MATRIAWLLNLDAERELRILRARGPAPFDASARFDAPERYVPSPAIEARSVGLRARLSLLLAAEDRLIGRDLAADLERCERALAFCPTPSALARIARAGLAPPPAPPLAVLVQVNRRAFAAELGQTLPGARYVRTMEELIVTLRVPQLTDVWLLKRDFSFAGRERRRVYGSMLDAPTLGFVRRSFARHEGLQVEPWLPHQEDFAQHGYVLADGRVLLGPALRQHCNEQGGWLASEPLPDGALSERELAALEASARVSGEALARAGYHGPFGVDGYRYPHPETDADRQAGAAPCFQPRSELNARFSMGYPRELLERALCG